jgi:imidazolonepropionase-like amidohydrolase
LRKANEVLKTATKNAAIACGVDRFTGVIKEGMTADIVAF